ncbi:MAG: putative selenium-dependent hydroxylase accessory protein YqeC [Desulfovibrio sp.]|nr:putative selenium-dependent hydroxylase accessory protein YqeC [Desulfovibrio sp.]
MRHESVSLLEELVAVGPGLVCLSGGGGKTTLLYALGLDMAKAGYSVLCTTTTRMFRPRPASGFHMEIRDDPSALTPPRGRAVFAARDCPSGAERNKVCGYGADEVNALYERGFAAWIFVEADGAAGRPVKAPAAHEPVVPARTAIVVGVIGMSCLLRPFTPDLVFRAERFAAVTGLAEGEIITPEVVAGLVLHPKGLFKNSPDTAVRMLFCNHGDLPGVAEAGKAVVEAVFSRDSSFLHAAYLGAAQVERLKCRKFIPD